MQVEQLLTQAELPKYAPSLDISAYDSTTLSGMITSASEQIRNYCNVDGFLRSTVTQKDRAVFNTKNELTLAFTRPRVRQGEVSALRYVQRGVNYTVDLVQDGVDIYYVQHPGNYMYVVSNYLGICGNGIKFYGQEELFYEVTYIGGYADSVEQLPRDLKRACAMMILADVSMDDDVTGVKSFRQGSYSETRESGSGASAIARAEKILDRGGFVRRIA